MVEGAVPTWVILTHAMQIAPQPRRRCEKWRKSRRRRLQSVAAGGKEITPFAQGEVAEWSKAHAC